jgi:hypothetical protein
MVGFDSGSEMERWLDSGPAPDIHSDLTRSLDLTLARRLRENRYLAFMGVTPAGPFAVPGAVARNWLRATANPNGRANSEVVRQYFNGVDLNQNRRDVWIVDFGTDMDLATASQYEAPFEFVREHVRPVRETSRVPKGDPWWLFTRPRPEMRTALQGLPRYIGTSLVSKHHILAWISAAVLPANLVIAIAREDDYFFGVLHSRVHELWALRQGTQLEDRPRYTPTTCFETFPFPWPPGKEPVDDPRVQAIAAAAKDLVEKRDRWLNPEGATEAELKKRTLTNLYNQRPTWLDLAHKKLDQAVLDAYAWPHDLTDDQILERLLALNLQRAAEERGGK